MDDIPRNAPWLFPDGLPPAKDLSLGPVLLGLAVGLDSLGVAEVLVRGGIDPFSPLGGRSLLHLACEQKMYGSLLWLISLAKHRNRLNDLLSSCDQNGRQPLDVAIALTFTEGVELLAPYAAPTVPGESRPPSFVICSTEVNGYVLSPTSNRGRSVLETMQQLEYLALTACIVLYRREGSLGGARMDPICDVIDRSSYPEGSRDSHDPPALGGQSLAEAASP